MEVDKARHQQFIGRFGERVTLKHLVEGYVGPGIVEATIRDSDGVRKGSMVLSPGNFEYVLERLAWRTSTDAEEMLPFVVDAIGVDSGE